MRVVLTGATGVAGLGIYCAALADLSVQRITLLMRRALPSWAELPANVNAAEKTDIVLHDDFGAYPAAIVRCVTEHDVLIWALGRSAIGMSTEVYMELTYEYTMATARALKDAGAGTPEWPFWLMWISRELVSPQSLQMWANVKGCMECELPQLLKGTNIGVHILHLGYFFSSRAHLQDQMHQWGADEREFDTFALPIWLRFFASHYTWVEDMGRFAVEVMKGCWPEQVLFRNMEMKELLATLPASQSLSLDGRSVSLCLKPVGRM
ncbi:hypothetical protein V8D89_009025 [Ganoderma adspersum]